MFRDRIDAAQQLAEKLQKYRHKNPLILAIPRGAVPMGQTLAKALGGELDVVLVRKLRAPRQPELAIGSVDESGWTYLGGYALAHGADQEYIASEKAVQLETIRHRRAQYTPDRQPISPTGRIVIVVDDGLATGATMISALHSLREHRPEKLVCAVPVAPRDTLAKIRSLADELVCLKVPVDFQAVGQFYQQFTQVEDSDVIEILRHSAGPGSHLPPSMSGAGQP